VHVEFFFSTTWNSSIQMGHVVGLASWDCVPITNITRNIENKIWAQLWSVYIKDHQCFNKCPQTFHPLYVKGVKTFWEQNPQIMLSCYYPNICTANSIIYVSSNVLELIILSCFPICILWSDNYNNNHSAKHYACMDEKTNQKGGGYCIPNI